MSEYKVYEFWYRGECISGTILIVSKSEESAHNIAKAELLKQGSNPDSLSFRKSSELTNGAIIYNFNGDY